MSDLSTQIRLSFQNVIQVYQEVASLLQDADEMMKDSGLPCLHTTYVGTEQSKSMSSPRWWVTPFAARYYGNDEDVCLLRVIAVFMVNRNYDPIDPLLVFGWLRLKETEEGKRPNYWYGYVKEAWFSWLPDRQLGIDMAVSNPKWNVVAGMLHAVPLDDVKDQNDLREKVVMPLVAMAVPMGYVPGDQDPARSDGPSVDGGGPPVG